MHFNRDYKKVLKRGKWINSWNTPKDQEYSAIVLIVCLTIAFFVLLLVAILPMG